MYRRNGASRSAVIGVAVLLLSGTILSDTVVTKANAQSPAVQAIINIVGVVLGGASLALDVYEAFKNGCPDGNPTCTAISYVPSGSTPVMTYGAPPVGTPDGVQVTAYIDGQTNWGLDSCTPEIADSPTGVSDSCIENCRVFAATYQSTCVQTTSYVAQCLADAVQEQPNRCECRIVQYRVNCLAGPNVPDQDYQSFLGGCKDANPACTQIGYAPYASAPAIYGATPDSPPGVQVVAYFDGLTYTSWAITHDWCTLDDVTSADPLGVSSACLEGCRAWAGSLQNPCVKASNFAARCIEDASYPNRCKCWALLHRLPC